MFVGDDVEEVGVGTVGGARVAGASVPGEEFVGDGVVAGGDPPVEEGDLAVAGLGGPPSPGVFHDYERTVAFIEGENLPGGDGERGVDRAGRPESPSRL